MRKKRKTNKEILGDIEKRKKVSAKKPNPDIKIACVFSCPGKKELDSGEFLSGTTGDNFVILLCSDQSQELFSENLKSLSSHRFDLIDNVFSESGNFR